MDILSYLSELVQTRKAVGIPGLGTIYKKKSPGRYDAETHSFIPPSYTLHFTEEVKEETLLSASISQKRGISIENASYFIKEFSDGLHQQLNDHHEASLGTLGKLSAINGRLEFESANELNYGFDFYGLPTVKADPVPSQNEDIEQPATDNTEQPVTEEPTIAAVVADNELSEENPGDHPAEPAAGPISTEDIKEEETADDKKKDEEQLRAEIEALNFYRSKSPVSKTSAPTEETILKLQENDPAVILADHEKIQDVFEPDQEKKTTSVYIKILAVIVLLLILVAAAFIIKPEVFNGLTGVPDIVQPLKNQQAVIPAKDSATVQDTAKNDSSAVSLIKDTVKAGPAAKPADSVTSYEIIGASVLNQKEADHFIALMKKSGITAKVVTNIPGKRLKMSIATLQDEKSARLERERLEKKLKIKGIYIYRNKQL